MYVRDLTPEQLDYWVAAAELRIRGDVYSIPQDVPPYSSNCELAESIAVREGIVFFETEDEDMSLAAVAHYRGVDPFDESWFDRTFELATMRCFVAKVFGSELPDVDIGLR